MKISDKKWVALLLTTYRLPRVMIATVARWMVLLLALAVVICLFYLVEVGVYYVWRDLLSRWFGSN